MTPRKVTRTGAFIVTTNRLEDDDHDWHTPRLWRDPSHPSGTGERAKLVLVEMILVPTHPEWQRAGGNKYDRLYWCKACKSYEHPDYDPCKQRGGFRDADMFVDS